MKTQLVYSVKKSILLMMAFIIPCVLLAQGFPTKRILDILVDGSDLWIAGDAGVIKYDKTTGKQIIHNPFTGAFSYSKTALKLAKDHEENIWATSVHHGIAKFSKDVWTRYSESQGDFPIDQWNFAIVVDKDNNKWIGNCMYLVKSDNEKWKKWSPETMECEYSSQFFITAMALDHDGILWIGGDSYSCGSFGKFTENGFEFYNMEYPDWIVHVNSIAIDKENSVWIGMSWGGLSKYDRQQFTTYTTENSNIPDNNVYDIKMDKEGNLWLACSTYLVKFDGATFTKYEHPDIQSFIHCLAIEDNGDIWVGTHDDGLFLFSKDEFQPIELNLLSVDEPYKPENNTFTVFANASEMIIDFSLPEIAQVSLSVFDMQGKEACNLLKNSNLTSGKHQYSWSYAKSSSGLYLVRYTVNGAVNVKKVIIP